MSVYTHKICKMQKLLVFFLQDADSIHLVRLPDALTSKQQVVEAVQVGKILNFPGSVTTDSHCTVQEFGEAVHVHIQDSLVEWPSIPSREEIQHQSDGNDKKIEYKLISIQYTYILESYITIKEDM